MDWIKFCSNVQDLLNAGWKCQGGVCVAMTPFETRFYQAVIKETTEDHV